MLIDTDVMVDIMRGYEPAISWIRGFELKPGLPGFVALELMNGCRNKKEMSDLQKILSRFRIHWPGEVDYSNCIEHFPEIRLRDGIGPLDILIGETAVGMDATLCTFNEKHFASIPGLQLLQPYAKS
ncbi:MAG: PIN domain-containing protein [Planctomycetes bacterium]|nr:PIN domain-containing protein [Planctomycetota bacterium]